MHKSINRFIAVIQSEGISVAVNRVKKIIAQFMGVQVSETYFFRRGPDSQEAAATATDSEDVFTYHIFTNKDELQSCGAIWPDKFNFIPTDEWFERGSVCIGLMDAKTVAAYTWFHRNAYDNLGMAGTLWLDRDEVCLGPFYTVPAYRRRGLYRKLMRFSLDHLHSQTIFLASNINNIATIKVAVGSGFEVVGLIRASRGLGRSFIEFTPEKIVATKFKNQHE